MKIPRNIFAFLAAAAMVFSACAASAQTAREFFILGNNAYKSGDYQKAKSCYEDAIAGGMDGANVRYNLANAQSKLGEKGGALLNYKRAVMDAPRMREAAANLQMFAKDNSLDDGFGNFANPLVAELSLTEWTLAAFALFWASALLFLIPPMFGKRTAATVFSALICAALFAAAAVSASNWVSFADCAVALKSDSPLRLSPAPDAPVSAMSAEGQTVKILKKRGEYFYAETANGKRGWASKKDFAKVGR